MNHPQQATLLNGTVLAQRVRAEVTDRVQVLQKLGVVPRLDVILVGTHGPSQTYVKYKVKAAKEVGIETVIHRFNEQVDPSELREAVRKINAQPQTHGILVQLPLPSHISQLETWSIVEEIHPHKDVDGFHPINQGLIGQRDEGLIACTPLGCMRLIREIIPDLNGVHAVVIGRSRIVGRPMAQLLTAAHATVTVCHSRTVDLMRYTRQADLIVAAAGVPKLLTASMIKPGAVVIDVGIHHLSQGGLCGDVDFDRVVSVAGALTPVPGGVGPMTIATLMQNVCLAAERQSHASDTYKF